MVYGNLFLLQIMNRFTDISITVIKDRSMVVLNKYINILKWFVILYTI